VDGGIPSAGAIGIGSRRCEIDGAAAGAAGDSGGGDPGRRQRVLTTGEIAGWATAHR
jgi:hypothetical protein